MDGWKGHSQECFSMITNRASHHLSAIAELLVFYHLCTIVGSVTLLCTAPLTNIAVALMLDPSFGNKLKNCVMMGGNYYEGVFESSVLI